ncbi:MFS transporter [Sphingorhabdus sp. EL138]|uniref:MFS transporter n=1 Tax=Sphingorhabdus sp. EL138 TaxID=2073156 RepID=UPI000D698AD6|nr:MFS transporter [Sphingorhabdus sp. EL138]
MTTLGSARTVDYPSNRYAWYTVFMLTIAYVVSFVDRYILGLMIEPIKTDLGLSDTQIGLLLGPAFAIFYVTMGLPFGWLVDRKKRTWIISAGIAVWSAATVLSGFARNFVQLFIARMGVGIGEAALSPAALSMISDSFVKERRARAVAFYTMAASLGAGLASLLGAALLTWAETVPKISLPVVGIVNAWQLSFIIVGLPGLLLSLFFLVMREPPRMEYISTKEGQENSSSVSEMLHYVGVRWRAFAGFVSLMCLLMIEAFGQKWGAPLFERTWGWDAASYATVNGIILLVFGPLTVNAAGWAADRLLVKGIRDAPLCITIGGVVIMFVTGRFMPLMPNPEMAFVMISINTVGIAMAAGTAITALLNITPGQIRGQVVALYFVCINLAGLMLGPTSVAFLTDNFLGEENLRYSMSLAPLILGLPVIILIPFIRRYYLNQLSELERMETSKLPDWSEN